MFKGVLLLSSAIGVGLLASQGLGQAPAQTERLVEPKADEALRKMSTYLAAARQFSFNVQVTSDDVLDSGQKIQFSNARKIVVVRPNKAHAELSGDLDNGQACYDGRTFATLDNNQRTYSVTKVPDTLDKAMDYLVERYGLSMPLADIMISDPYASAIQHVRIGRYIGSHSVNRIKCHHLAFRQDLIDWQIWIEDSETPLPRKLVITYKEQPGQPQFVAIFDQWNMSPQVPEDLFTFKAPAGARKVELQPLRQETAPGAQKQSSSAAPEGK
jgi:hypothetical protein